MNLKSLFLQHVGQTSMTPLMLEVAHAEGMYITDISGKKYLDLISGFSVSSLGHRHPRVVEAIKTQADLYLHTTVYGEHVQSPQVKYASKLAAILDNGLDAIYYVNSGAEAIEVAIKLGRKATHRSEIISCANAYHGSTTGAEALRSDYDFSRNFMPSLPGVRHIQFNSEADLSKITNKTACVILEPVQAEAGVISPQNNYLQKLRKRCDETGTLLFLDEIQTGFGRTGHLFAHQKYNVLPDAIMIAKGMGGGMPVGAVVASRHLLKVFADNPMLGHINTFGGHPVCIAAALANLEVLLEEKNIIGEVIHKSEYLTSRLKHDMISEVRADGLLMAVELTRPEYLMPVIKAAVQRGALIDFYLFNDRSFRLSPPLIISNDQMEEAVNILLDACTDAHA